MPNVKVRKLRENAQIPNYMTAGAAGCDITACLETAIVVGPGKRVAVPTGLAFEIPEDFEIQVRPRSGLSFKRGLTVINAPGTIDSDYRGEVQVLMVNVSDESVTIDPGERVAQLVLQKVERIQWVEAEVLAQSARNDGGFGSTGKI